MEQATRTLDEELRFRPLDNQIEDKHGEVWIMP